MKHIVYVKELKRSFILKAVPHLPVWSCFNMSDLTEWVCVCGLKSNFLQLSSFISCGEQKLRFYHFYRCYQFVVAALRWSESSFMISAFYPPDRCLQSLLSAVEILFVQLEMRLQWSGGRPSRAEPDRANPAHVNAGLKDPQTEIMRRWSWFCGLFCFSSGVMKAAVDSVSGN